GGAFPASVRLDAHELHHLAPFLGLFSNELAEVGGRTAERNSTQIAQSRFDLGIGKRRIDLFVELLDHIDNRILGRADSELATRLESWHEIANGWDVWQRRRARHRGHRQRAQPAGANVLE